MQMQIDNYSELAREIQKAQKIVVLSGAGLSVASGIPDFRTSQGAFWLKNQDRVKLMSANYRDAYPFSFWPAFKEIFELKMNNTFDPNYGHIFIKELEDMGKEVTIATQNVDGLHQKAGSSIVHEIHGSMNSASCPRCKTQYDLQYIIDNDIPECNHVIHKENVCNNYLVIHQTDRILGSITCDDYKCGTKHKVDSDTQNIRCKGKKKSVYYCNDYLRPDVVLFGDLIKDFDKAEKAAKECDLMLVLGTSLQVYPVNGLPFLANKLAIINLHPTDIDEHADYVIHNDLVESLKEIKKFL